MKRSVKKLKAIMAVMDAISDVRVIARVFEKSTSPIMTDGGAGSGNFNHAGRPGYVGGSAEGSGSASLPSVPVRSERQPMRFKGSKPKDFHEAVRVAKESNKETDRWRVELKDEDGYNECKLYVSDGGSTIAIKPDGDIVSVCKHQGSGDRGSELLKKALKHGGDRLDAFGSGLFYFYTKNGFEPVSWTRFDEKYSPPDWKKGRDKKEPVVFYRYVGVGKVKTVKYGSFMKSTKASRDYDDAKSIRDRAMI